MAEPIFAAPLVCSQVHRQPEFESELRPDLKKILSSSKFSGQELIEYLSKDPEIKALYLAPTGLSSMPTIADHTLRVLNVLEEQWKFLEVKLPGMSLPPKIRLRELFRFTVALHDIGKGIAIFKGNRSEQLVFTNQIFREQLKIYGFSEVESRLGLALINGNIFGQLAEGHISVETGLERLKKIGKGSKVNLANYAVLRAFFFTCDAASYPWLQKKSFMAKDSGEIVPSYAAFYQLMALALGN